jgi:16S rRNA (guanine966-N2)-methyltransferase
MTRIIAGVVGGRRLVVPAGDVTRPTADRAREGLFSTLTSLLGSFDGASVLDLYAGSGAVGLEAASRGAARVVLVETAPLALRALHANIETVALPGVEVRAEPVARVLAGTVDSPYDVVFADPPYSQPIDGVLSVLSAGGWVAPHGVVCLERATRSDGPEWPAGFVALRSRRYGEATLWYGRRS